MANRSKHSPAPWTETENDDGDVIVHMDESHSIVVANLEGSCTTCHANAHLIAAAPELLEVLQEIEWSYMDRYCPVCGNTELNGHDDTCKLATVIAKAKGES